MTNALLTPLLLTVVPSQLTHFLLPHLSATLPQLLPPSPKGSPTYQRNFKLVFTAVISLWLAYSFVSNGNDELSWYDVLGVARDADDDGLRKAFRTLSRTHHPDRAGSSSEERFIRLRQAYEALSDPVKRYAYDRFGPDILQWRFSNGNSDKVTATVRDYIWTGLMQSSGFYVVSSGFMLVLSVVGRAKEGAFWRHTLFILLFVLELSLVLSPTAPISPFNPFSLRPQYQQILLLHRLWTTVSVGITQLAGVWLTPETKEPEEVYASVLGLVRTIELEGKCLSSVAPENRIEFRSPDPRELELLIQREMQQVLVDKAVSTHPHIQPQWQAALSRSYNSHKAHQSLQHSHRSRHQLPTPSPEPYSPDTDLHLARSIPLPLSPPPSPRPDLF
ncbi:hypothetical protein P7C73_g2105, partial [Tremellales sp. Uapishka_1]